MLPKPSNIRSRPLAWLDEARLNMFRLAWIVITFLVLAIFLAGIPTSMGQLVQGADERALTQLGMSPQVYSVYLTGLNFLVVITHIGIAWLIFIRQPSDWMALFVSFTLVANGAAIPLSQMQSPYGLAPGLWNFLVSLITYIGLTSSIIVVYLFPTGRFVPHWTRWFAWIWAVVVFLMVFVPSSPISLSQGSHALQLGIYFVWSAVGVYAQVHRFQFVSTPVQRQQTKWALLGLTAAVIGPAVYFTFASFLASFQSTQVSNLLFQRTGGSFFALAILARLGVATLAGFLLLSFPLSFAIAIMRYRLWDIDILIRRTLIYSALSITLAFVYMLSVIILAQVFRSVTGERQSELVIVIATLASAGLATPLRNRIQYDIDRNFYRQKYDSEQTLEAFSRGLQSELYTDTLCQRLVEAVDKTMQPQETILWLRKTPDETQNGRHS